MLTDNLTFDAGGYVIKQSAHITILGCTIKKLQNDILVNANCYYKLHCLRQVANILNLKSRLQLANIIIIGILNYGLSDIKLLQKLNKILVLTARYVIGSFCFKFSYNDILKCCGWISIYQMINVASVKLFRQIIMTKEPKPIYQLFKPGQINTINTHCVSKYYTKIKLILADT